MFLSQRALRGAALSFVLSLAGFGSAPASTLPPAPTPIASFDAGTLHVDTYGSGPRTLILIPGLGSGPWEWYGTIAHFAPAYTIYAITLPGFDGIAATTKTPLFATFAGDFWAMLDARKITKPVVIGHSIGGTLAIALGEQHPERLGGIVSVDGLPVFPMLASATAAQRAGTGAKMAAAYGALAPDKELAAEVGYMSTVGTIDPALVVPAAQLEAKSDPKAVGAWAQEDIDGDLRPDLAKLTTPLLEIMPYNAADAKPPTSYTQDQTLAFYQMLLNGAPHVKVVPIAPSRHFAMLDQPDRFYGLIAAFLTDNP
jgi:pimeloyl-ACP methyl ester carboxylesterase